MKENSLEWKYGEDRVRSVEVDVSENIRHNIVDNMPQTGVAIQKKGHSFRSDPLEKAWHDDGMKISAT